MQTRIVVILAVLMLIASPSKSQEASPDPLTGKWDVTFEIQGSTTPAIFQLELVGDKISGTAESDHTGPGKVRNGTWRENTLSFTLDFASHESIDVTGRLQDGRLVGEFRTEGMQGKWEAKRSSASAHAELHLHGPYASYEFLIGKWDVSAEGGGPSMAVQRFSWGPNHSYIWYAASLIVKGSEQPHLEGILMWNGVHRNLDMLLAIDPSYGLAQEQGTLSVDPDGTIVRDITAVYSEGAMPVGQPRIGPAGGTGHFRQTFKSLGSDKALTTLMREAERGWVATFPGSDHLVMARRTKG